MVSLENIKKELDYEFYLATSVDCTNIKEIVPMNLEEYIKTNIDDLKIFPGKKKRLFNLGKIKDICKNPFSNK